MLFDRLTRAGTAPRLFAFGLLSLLAGAPSQPVFADALSDVERGHQATRQGDYRAALILLSRAIKSGALDDGNLAVAYNNRCAVFNVLLRLDQALGDCTRAVQLQPEFARAYVNRGMSLRRFGRFAPAIVDYSKAIALEPELVPAYGNRGYARYRLGAFESASTDYEKAIELAPKISLLHGGLGIVRFAQERFDDAATHFLDARRLDLSSAYWPLWHHLAVSRAGHDGGSDLKSATQMLDLRKWPAPVISFLLGDLDEAPMLDRAGADSDTADPLTRCEGLFFAGQYQLSAGQPERAIEHFMKILDIKAIDVCDHTVAIAELTRLGVNLLPTKEQIDIHGGGQ